MIKIIKSFFKFYEWLIELVDETPITFNYYYDFLKDLDSHKSEIIDEYKKVKSAVFGNISQSTAPDKYFKNANWNVFFFIAHGSFLYENCSQCPVTFSILKKYKNIKLAMFSTLPPNSTMAPHRGPLKGVLRCLYKLEFKGERNTACLQIKNKIFDWYDNDYIIFDDTLTHNTWNNSDKPRVVLFLDIERPLIFPINLFNKLVLFLVSKNKNMKEIFEFYKKSQNYKD
jgi:beta-hydroxylase